MNSCQFNFVKSEISINIYKTAILIADNMQNYGTALSWDIYDGDASDHNLRNQIAIPAKWMERYLAENEVSAEPLYLKVARIDFAEMPENWEPFDHIVFSGADILPSGNGSDLCVMPLWAMNKLSINQFTEVSVDKVHYLEKVAYLKVKASTKQYAEWNGLREILEDYLSTIYCINVGDLLYIGGIEFYVTQLMNADYVELSEGSLFQTDVKLDFETPVDLEQEEHLAELESVATHQSVRDEAARIEKSRPTRAQIAALYEKKMRQN